MEGSNITNQDFLNGPVIYTPLEALIDQCAIISGENLINAADNGTSAVFPREPGQYGSAYRALSRVTPDFTYVLPNPDVIRAPGRRVYGTKHHE